MLSNIVSYLIQPHKFINIRSYLPDSIPVEYVRIKYLYCGICGGDYSRYLGYRTEYPISLGHEFVAQILDYNGLQSTDFKKGDYVVSDFNYRCNNCSYCQKGKTHLCMQNNMELFTNRAFSLYADVHYSYLTKIDLNFKQIYRATTIEPLSCILHALDNYDLSKVKRILVYGVGNIGMLCAFYLHNCCGKDVYIYDTFEKKCILVAQTLGCNMADLHNTYDLIIEATNNTNGLLTCIMGSEYNQSICSFSHLYGQNTDTIYTALVKKESNIYFPLRNGSKTNLSRAAQIIKTKWTTREDRLIKIYETDDLCLAFEAKKNCIQPKQVIKFKVVQENE